MLSVVYYAHMICLSITSYHPGVYKQCFNNTECVDTVTAVQFSLL